MNKEQANFVTTDKMKLKADEQKQLEFTKAAHKKIVQEVDIFTKTFQRINNMLASYEEHLNILKENKDNIGKLTLLTTIAMVEIKDISKHQTEVSKRVDGLRKLNDEAKTKLDLAVKQRNKIESALSEMNVDLQRRQIPRNFRDQHRHPKGMKP